MAVDSRHTVAVHTQEAAEAADKEAAGIHPAADNHLAERHTDHWLVLVAV